MSDSDALVGASLSDADAMEIGAVVGAGGLVLAEDDPYDLDLDEGILPMWPEGVNNEDSDEPRGHGGLGGDTGESGDMDVPDALSRLPGAAPPQSSSRSGRHEHWVRAHFKFEAGQCKYCHAAVSGGATNDPRTLVAHLAKRCHGVSPSPGWRQVKRRSAFPLPFPNNISQSSH